MSKVAQDFGISNVALKKICSKHRVPSPPRGYWAKKEAGKPVKQPRLAETADPLDGRITIFGSNHAALPEPVREILQRARAARVAGRRSISPDSPPPILSAEQVHPSITATAKRLRTQKPNKAGVVSATVAGCCGIDISAARVERCIAILNALAHSLTAHGVELVADGGAMTITSSGKKVTFRLKEFVRRDKHVPTMDELEAEERRQKRQKTFWDFSSRCAYAEWDDVCTGQLSIEVENQYVSGMRRTWKDAKRRQLEGAIDQIAAGIIAYAVALQLRAEADARWHRNYERRARVESRDRARQEREGARKKILDGLVAVSTEASKLRTWLDDAKRWPPRTNPDEFTRFVDWARQRLEYLERSLDPDGIANRLKEQQLFPAIDPLIDPPEDFIEE